MNKYIDSEKLIAAIDKILLMADKEEKLASLNKDDNGHLLVYATKIAICETIKRIAIALQWEQPDNMYNSKKPFYDKLFHQWRIEYTTKDGGYCAILADTEEECVERYEYKSK